MKEDMRSAKDGSVEGMHERTNSAAEEQGFRQVLTWTDPKTCESLSVEVWGTKDFISELVSTGFTLGAAPADHGRVQHCYVSVDHDTDGGRAAADLRNEP